MSRTAPRPVRRGRRPRGRHPLRRGGAALLQLHFEPDAGESARCEAPRERGERPRAIAPGCSPATRRSRRDGSARSSTPRWRRGSAISSSPHASGSRTTTRRAASQKGRSMIGQHGSWSPEETTVPLLRFGAYAGLRRSGRIVARPGAEDDLVPARHGRRRPFFDPLVCVLIGCGVVGKIPDSSSNSSSGTSTRCMPPEAGCSEIGSSSSARAASRSPRRRRKASSRSAVWLDGCAASSGARLMAETE